MKRDGEPYTTVYLKGDTETVLRIRVGSLKIRRGVCRAHGIHGSRFVFPLGELLRAETLAAK